MNKITKKTEKDNNIYLQNIKVNNSSVTGDCPICGYEDIGFNYGSNAAAYPINCGWAGSFQMSCPGCGSVFGDGGHSMPKDTNYCLKFLENKDILNKRKEKINNNKEYLNNFKKELDLEHKENLKLELNNIIQDINVVVLNIDSFFENELEHFYYSPVVGWCTRRSGDCVAHALVSINLFGNKEISEKEFIKVLLDNREKIKELSIDYHTKKTEL